MYITYLFKITQSWQLPSSACTHLLNKCIYCFNLVLPVGGEYESDLEGHSIRLPGLVINITSILPNHCMISLHHEHVFVLLWPNKNILSPESSPRPSPYHYMSWAYHQALPLWQIHGDSGNSFCRYDFKKFILGPHACRSVLVLKQWFLKILNLRFPLAKSIYIYSLCINSEFTSG